MNDSIKYLYLLIVSRQEEMLSLGFPKPERIYSQNCAPFIPTQEAWTNEIEQLLRRQSNCSDVRANAPFSARFARRETIVDLEHLLTPKYGSQSGNA